MSSRERARNGLAVRLLVGLVLLVAGTGVARADSQSDCSGWLPDLRCDRSGRYPGFEMPIMQPYLFEDPFITTGIYPYFMWNEFPDRSALGGGYVNAVAVQARLALTERVALIATKDGYVWERPDSPILDSHTGFMNLGGGVKVAWIDDRERDFILSSALRIEVPTGAKDIFEGGGGGILWIPSLSAAWGRDRLHWIGDVGGHIPSNRDRRSSLLFTHLYVDYALLPRFQPWIQLSGIVYLGSGDGTRRVRTRVGRLTLAQVEALVGDFEGNDLHNLGAAGVTHNNVWTLAAGFHVPLAKGITWSLGYERPVSSRKDLVKQRIMTMLRLEL